jgi:hypothetical protein
MTIGSVYRTFRIAMPNNASPFQRDWEYSATKPEGEPT